MGREAMDLNIKDFEAAIAELETIVKKLEDGELSLEQSLGLYERGVALARYCHGRLEEAERRLEVLSERGDLQPAPPSLAAIGAEEAEPRRGEAGPRGRQT
jgi:exodeoxyribonuclease VII small subunit